MIEALTIDAASTIRLLQSIEALYPMLALIHVFLDNARYHHAKLVRNGWPCRDTHQAALHSNVLPALEPDRTVMGPHAQKRHSQQVLRNLRPVRRCDAQFLREKVPGNWADLCDSVTDNFRVINPKTFRVMT